MRRQARLHGPERHRRHATWPGPEPGPPARLRRRRTACAAVRPKARHRQGRRPRCRARPGHRRPAAVRRRRQRPEPRPRRRLRRWRFRRRAFRRSDCSTARAWRAGPGRLRSRHPSGGRRERATSAGWQAHPIRPCGRRPGRRARLRRPSGAKRATGPKAHRHRQGSGGSWWCFHRREWHCSAHGRRVPAGRQARWRGRSRPDRWQLPSARAFRLHRPGRLRRSGRGRG